ncbi:hypothetical protein [Pseudomonas hormoni]
MIKSMLSLDLINGEKERDDLYALLEESGWKKVKDVDTVWLIEHPTLNQQDKDSLQTVKNHLATTLIHAAKTLKLYEVYYVAQLGNAEVIGRVVKKVNEKYSVYARELF